MGINREEKIGRAERPLKTAWAGRLIEPAITVLERHGHALERAQQNQGAADHQGPPQEGVDPQRRRQRKFDKGGRADDAGAKNEGRGDRRTVPGIVLGEVKPADRAFSGHVEEAVEKPTLAAAGTAAAQPAQEKAEKRRRFGHAGLIPGSRSLPTSRRL